MVAPYVRLLKTVFNQCPELFDALQHALRIVCRRDEPEEYQNADYQHKIKQDDNHQRECQAVVK